MNARLLVTSLLLGIFLLGCETKKTPITAETIVGSWDLQQVEGRSPKIILVKTWSLEIKADGTWSYKGSLSGKGDGTNLSGSGKWTVKDGVFDFTAEEHSGAVEAYFDGPTLVFSPDPVLLARGEKSILTTYEHATP